MQDNPVVKYIDCMDDGDLEKLVVGRRIVDINEAAQTLTLDDGTELEFEQRVDCCASFSPDLKAINLTENAITAVTREELELDDDTDVHWRATILSYDEPVATLEVDGNLGTGYYGNSIDLAIRKSAA